MQIVSFRLPTETVQALKTRAWQESLRVGRNISFSSLIREAIDEVAKPEVTKKPSRPQEVAVAV